MTDETLTERIDGLDRIIQDGALTCLLAQLHADAARTDGRAEGLAVAVAAKDETIERQHSEILYLRGMVAGLQKTLAEKI